MMRLTTIVSALVIAGAAFGQDKYVVVLMDVPDADGKRVQFRTDTAAIAKTPDWSPGLQEPPLTITAATRIAREAGQRRLPKADNIEIDSVALRKIESYGQNGSGMKRLTRWYYAFTISPVMNRNASHGTSETVVVILLDGSVIEPSPMQ
jgi:hypothetical protein